MSAKKGHMTAVTIGKAATRIIAGMERGDIGSNALAEAIKVNPVLLSLNLADAEIADIGATSIAEALKENKTLQVLRLGVNQITDTGAIEIAEALRLNKSLERLDLDNNQITNVGAIAFSEALKLNNTLKSLSLNVNKIADAGIIAISKSLVGNTTLATLVIFGNIGITDKSVPALEEMLRSSHNTSMGVGKQFRDTSISETAQKRLWTLGRIPFENRKIPQKALENKHTAFIARHPRSTEVDDVVMKVRNILGGEVLVDGGKHQHLDISQLLNEINGSKAVLWLLLRKEVVEMPVCLIELNHAIVNGIPIVIAVGKEEINLEETIEFMEQLETKLRKPALELMKWCGVDVGEVGRNVSKMITNATRNKHIKRLDIHKEAYHLQEEIKEIVRALHYFGEKC